MNNERFNSWLENRNLAKNKESERKSIRPGLSVIDPNSIVFCKSTSVRRNFSPSNHKVWEMNNDLVVLSLDGIDMSVCLTKTTFTDFSGFLDETQMIVLQLLVKKSVFESYSYHNPCESCPFLVYYRDENSTSFHKFSYIDKAEIYYQDKLNQAVNLNWPKGGLKHGWQAITQFPRNYNFYNHCLVSNNRKQNDFNFQSVNPNVKELLRVCNGNPSRNFKSAPAEYRCLWAGMPDEQVYEARKALFDILKSLRDSETNKLAALSSTFYTLVPCWTLNKNSMIINNYTKLGSELNRLDFIEGTNNDFPKRLHFISKETKTFKLIESAIITTHGPNHLFGVRLDQVFSFDDGHKLASNAKTLLLWHGSHASCVPGNLRRGFEMPTTSGQLHGKAVYFTPCASKASKYCNVAKGSGIRMERPGVLLLCEVAVDNAEVQTVRQRYFNPCRGSTNSQTRTIHSVGRYQTSGQVVVDGTNMQVGPMKDVNKQDNYLVNYDEYAIYDKEKIKVRFVVLVKLGAEVCNNPGT